MLVIEGLNFGLIGQEPLKIEHHFGTAWHVTEGSQVFTTTPRTCSCGENDCRHIEAVKEQTTKKDNKLPMSPDRMAPMFRAKAWELRWKECQRQAEIERESHNGVYLDPEIEF